MIGSILTLRPSKQQLAQHASASLACGYAVSSSMAFVGPLPSAMKAFQKFPVGVVQRGIAVIGRQADASILAGLKANT